MDKEEWKDWLNVKLLQKVAIVDEEGNILVLTRNPKSPGSRPGKPDLPGGSFSPEDLTSEDNPHLEAVKREIKEETGLTVQNIEVIHASSGIKPTQTAGKVLIMALGYKAGVKGVKPEVTLGQEHTEYQWLPKNEALSLDFGNDGGLHKAIIEAI
ncbi:MAG TPA: NUDIX domain-containing protein [Patescibacteria group bacterium]|nr:NUDIX domain-containing protein [Patescibacteria group bacterium]